MATTIRTSSKNYFTKIQKYLYNKRIFFTPSLNDGVYALTIFDLSSIETTSSEQNDQTLPSHHAAGAIGSCCLKSKSKI